MADITNYSKEEMEVLREDIARQKSEYQSLIESLEANIVDIHNYWVEGDAGAEAVYTSLQSQFNQFKKDLREGIELMTKFENQVSSQIQNYEEAEAKVKNAIGW